MKNIYLLLLFICTAANAGVGKIDEREYVSWGTHPYNNIVYFYTREWGTCTAQYVAPDIILTARHCITKDKDFDNNKHIGEEFTIKLHDGRKTQVRLEQYGRDLLSDDWALLRVTDKNFYNRNAFSVSPENKLRSVTNAGFGYMRILKDDEIKKLKKIFKKTAKENNLSKTKFLDLIMPSAKDITANGISLLIDLTDETTECLKGGNQDDCVLEFKLKAHKGCALTKMAKDNRTVINNCDAMQGNSGGPYFADNIVYGIVSRGIDSFKNKRNGMVTAVSPRIIWEKLQGLQSSPAPTTPMPTPTDNQNITKQELEQREQDLNERAKNIENQSDEEFFHFLSDATEYAVLQKNYERAKAREQSLSNKILGAAGIGATGIGGMMLASGLAEQNADEEAERDMRAYLATFRCDYGAGRNITGGQKNIQLPGADELIQYTTEYKQIAANLKAAKEALGMLPGIESAVVFDSATSGLYDNVSIGRQRGAFTSLSRALLDENSADAAEWQGQTQNAKKKTKTGAITAGIGAGGSAIGNLIINHKSDDNETGGKSIDKNTVQ